MTMLLVSLFLRMTYIGIPCFCLGTTISGNTEKTVTECQFGSKAVTSNLLKLSECFTVALLLKKSFGKLINLYLN